MTREEKPVVRIEARGPVVKDEFPDKHTPWGVAIRYVCDDGSTYDTVRRHGRKRDAVAFAASLPAPPERDLRVMVHDSRFAGTVQRFQLY